MASHERKKPEKPTRFSTYFKSTPHTTPFPGHAQNPHTLTQIAQSQTLVDWLGRLSNRMDYVLVSV